MVVTSGRLMGRPVHGDFQSFYYLWQVKTDLMNGFWDLCDLTDFNLRSPMRRRGRERERDQGGVSDHVDDPH